MCPRGSDSKPERARIREADRLTWGFWIDRAAGIVESRPEIMATALVTGSNLQLVSFAPG
jgi:hypothetical protein